MLARETVTPSGVHHWPVLREPWNTAAEPGGTSPPSPPHPPKAEVLVEDRLGRFLPLRLEWPPLTDSAAAPIATVALSSAPQRLPPAGATGIVGLLADAGGEPAAWARRVAIDEAGRATEGASDADGRFALLLPFPRPERRSGNGSPPRPVTGSPAALVTLRVFHDAAFGVETARAAQASGASNRSADTRVATPPDGAPLIGPWRAQGEVRALARDGSDDPLGPLRLQAGGLAVPRTDGLPSNRSELRLAPL